MALKIPTTITKDWVKNNCRCIRRKDQPTWLLCRESCPVHETVNMTDAAQTSIERVTRELGWRLDWYKDQPVTKEKRA